MLSEIRQYIRILTLSIGFFITWITVVKAQVRVEVELVATPLLPDNPLFIAVDFNNWNPGDPRFALKKGENNKYYIELEDAPDKFEYKFTQGTWMLVEGTPQGETLPNRTYERTINPSGLISNTIIGWEKQVAYTFIIKNIPENTPQDARIFVTGNFNNWDPGNAYYQLKRKIDGTYQTIIYSDLEKIEYKFTRGGWPSVEARSTGKARPNRIINRDSKINNKSVTVDIEGWEDLMGTLHFFSLYDLLLIFSVFQGILLIIAIPSIQSNNIDANRWLIFSIVISSVAILLYLMSNYQLFVNQFPRLILFSDFIYFLYAPVFYFYLIKLLFNVRSLPSRWYLHFVPALIQFFAYLPFMLNTDKNFLLDVMNQKQGIIRLFLISGVLGFLWNAYYWNLFRKTIKTYRLEFQTNLSYDQNLNYLNTVLIIQFICLCLWAFSFIIAFIGRAFTLDIVSITENSIDITWLAFSIIPYFLGYFAIHQSETFKAAPRTISIFDDVLETEIGHGLSPSSPKQEDTSDENLLPYLEKLEAHMAENKPYINPKLTLNELAVQIKLQPHLVSKVINEHLHKNFFDYINSYRIDEFKRMVSDPKNHHLTFLSLAYEVGFNSKTAFNRSFKKITDQTPRDYFDQVKNGKT